MTYLIHFDQEYKGCRHYIGYTKSESVDDRLRRHKQGNGAKLLQVLNLAGITYSVVRTWVGDRKFERLLKKQKNASRFCPVCNPDGYMNNKKEEEVND